MPKIQWTGLPPALRGSSVRAAARAEDHGGRPLSIKTLGESPNPTPRTASGTKISARSRSAARGSTRRPFCSQASQRRGRSSERRRSGRKRRGCFVTRRPSNEPDHTSRNRPASGRSSSGPRRIECRCLRHLKMLQHQLLAARLSPGADPRPEVRCSDLPPVLLLLHPAFLISFGRRRAAPCSVWRGRSGRLRGAHTGGRSSTLRES